MIQRYLFRYQFIFSMFVLYFNSLSQFFFNFSNSYPILFRKLQRCSYHCTGYCYFSHSFTKPIVRLFIPAKPAGSEVELKSLSKTVTDKTTQIKLNEVVNILVPLEKNQNVKDDNIIALLQFHQLISEIKSVK